MKKYKILSAMAILVVLGIFLFFYQMYQSDVKALKNFTDSYQKFDLVIANFTKTPESNTKAEWALSNLNAYANFKLSSLTKNDSLIPPVALEVANSAAQELADLKTNNKYFADVSLKRKTAYAHFLELVK